MSNPVLRFVFVALTGILPMMQDGFAQEIEVSGGFLADSLRIGDEIPYYLTARYPTQLTILFPDSTHSFEPFEYAGKKFFTTRTSDGLSFDSVVYKFTTFEVDSIQSLGLPVYVVAKRDCTEYRADFDSVFLISLLSSPPPDTVQVENLPLKTDTRYENVLWLFNYPILVGVVVGLLILLIVGWIIFGKRIRKYFLLKKLQRQFNDFQSKFRLTFDQVRNNFNVELTEQTLFTWKRYLERLEKKPFTKLTTRETILMENDQQLGESLKQIDKAIYGHSTSVADSLSFLEQVAEQRFTMKLEEIKNG